MKGFTEEQFLLSAVHALEHRIFGRRFSRVTSVNKAATSADCQLSDGSPISAVKNGDTWTVSSSKVKEVVVGRFNNVSQDWEWEIK